MQNSKCEVQKLFALQWPDDRETGRVCLSAVFDDEAEAREYAERCEGATIKTFYAASTEPAVWLRNERGEYNGPERNDPLVLLAEPVQENYRATYAPLYATPVVVADTQPTVWVAADTLNSPHPTCISSLAYMSQLDQQQGREYIPFVIPSTETPMATQNVDDSITKIVEDICNRLIDEKLKDVQKMRRKIIDPDIVAHVSESRAEALADYQKNGASAVRFAPSSAHWSNELIRLFGPDAREGIDVLEKRLRDAEEDARRLDWLETKVVNVRTPLLHGSQNLFWASPQCGDVSEPDGPSDIRAKIDAARTAIKEEKI